MAVRSVKGRFAKGVSGNPGGRPREVGDVRDLARARTVEAITVLSDIMNDPDTPPAARVTAAVALLDRGWGRPQQGIELSRRAEVKPIDVAPSVMLIMNAIAKQLEAPPVDEDPPQPR